MSRFSSLCNWFITFFEKKKWTQKAERWRMSASLPTCCFLPKCSQTLAWAGLMPGPDLGLDLPLSKGTTTWYIPCSLGVHISRKLEGKRSQTIACSWGKQMFLNGSLIPAPNARPCSIFWYWKYLRAQRRGWRYKLSEGARGCPWLGGQCTAGPGSCLPWMRSDSHWEVILQDCGLEPGSAAPAMLLGTYTWWMCFWLVAQSASLFGFLDLTWMCFLKE